MPKNKRNVEQNTFNWKFRHENVRNSATIVTIATTIATPIVQIDEFK